MELAAAIDWARDESARLSGTPAKSQGDLAPMVDFLRTWAGAGSSFYIDAVNLSQAMTIGFNSSNNSRVKSASTLLGLWCDFVEEGLHDAQPFEVRARIEASNDLMEQVQVLLDETGITPAAPVMLAGAALEELLRSRLESLPNPYSGKASIDGYATALRSAEVITKQQKKDIDQAAGMRNLAAHGRFDEIEKANAMLMSQSVNLLIQQLAP